METYDLAVEVVEGVHTDVVLSDLQLQVLLKLESNGLREEEFLLKSNLIKNLLLELEDLDLLSSCESVH